MSQRPIVHEQVDLPPCCPSRTTAASGRPVVHLQPEVLANALAEPHDAPPAKEPAT